MKLDSKTIDAIARKSAQYVLTGLKKNKCAEKEMVTAAEAAKILGISMDHIRKIKDDFPYIRRGSNKKGHIYFYRESLTNVPKSQNSNNNKQ